MPWSLCPICPGDRCGSANSYGYRRCRTNSQVATLATADLAWRAGGQLIQVCAAVRTALTHTHHCPQAGHIRMAAVLGTQYQSDSCLTTGLLPSGRVTSGAQCVT